jgi:hypothetical protein
VAEGVRERDARAVKPINVPAFEPCGKCAGGKVLRNGQTEQCECWIKWWESVRASLTGETVRHKVLR